EQFGDVVDPTIAIAVDDEEPVARANPTRLHREAVAMEIEEGGRILFRDQIDTATAEIEHDRIGQRAAEDAGNYLHVRRQRSSLGGKLADDLARFLHDPLNRVEYEVRRLLPGLRSDNATSHGV